MLQSSVSPTQRLALAEVPLAHAWRALASRGLWLDVGAATIRVRSDSRAFLAQLLRVYGCFPFEPAGEWADVHVEVERPLGLRRYLRPQLVLRCDGQRPFEPFPADAGLPLFEWGCNWLLAHRLHGLLLLHAGVLERDGLALVLPATPGSGKSTLTAALAERGWRLLSDEFGALDPEAMEFRAVLKPVALKNQSIEVLRRFAPQAVIGPEFPKTRKGRVAHLAPSAEAVRRRQERAVPGAVVMPKWEAGSVTQWLPLKPHVIFPSLAFNSFNYNLMAADGFRAIIRLVRECQAWQLVYSDLDDALATIERAWPQVIERARGDRRLQS